jgi:mRNA interferase MazF
MKIRQFEIWIADLNPRIGTEPGKVRPVIIVQTDLLNKHHPSTLICPVTTNVRPDSEILRVHLAKGSCGLDEACDVMIDHLRAIDNGRLLNKVGKVPAEAIIKIKENLMIILDLE